LVSGQQAKILHQRQAKFLGQIPWPKFLGNAVEFRNQALFGAIRLAVEADEIP
jgi:hypothetical protein